MAGSEAIVKTLPLVIALAMLCLLVSCSSSSSTPSAPTLTLITVSPTSPSVAAGLTEQFKATGTYTDGSTKDLTSTATWTSGTTTVATITSAGLATTKTQGSSTITAASGSVSGATTLEVTAPTLVSIAVTPANDTIAPGTFLQFTATGTYTDGSTQNLTTSATWMSADATIVSVSTAGLGAAVTSPPPGVGAATVITATSGSVNGNTGISVAAPTLNSITITDGNVTIAAGTSHQYTAIGVYSDGGQRNVTDQVTWGSSDMTVASISATGQGKGLVMGSSTISATLGSVSSPGVTLDVTSATVSSIVVGPVMNTIAPLTQLQFTAVATFTDSSTQDITQDATWSSSATGVATVDSTNQIGRVTAVSAGPVNILAALGGQTGSAPLTVSSATLNTITFRPISANIALLSSLQLLAIGNFSDGSTQFITEAATWSSSNSGAASVDTTGNVFGAGTGAATITAMLGGVSGTADINVENVTSLALTPPPSSLPVGVIAHLQAVATLTDGTTANVNASSTWTSNAPTVALAGDASDTRSLVYGLTPGTALIGAFFEPQIASAQVTFDSATLMSLTLTPVPANGSGIPINGTQDYKLTGTYSDGTTQVLANSQAQWSSADVTIAIVSPSGVATPISAGTTAIKAQYGGMSATASLIVQ
jgi:uncharacterized protein YjdB